jgi:hypothetical protein
MGLENDLRRALGSSQAPSLWILETNPGTPDLKPVQRTVQSDSEVCNRSQFDGSNRPQPTFLGISDI